MANCSGLESRRVITVGTASALQQAVTGANCGDTIQLESGTYSSALTFSRSCPANDPVILRGAANFGSTISNKVTLGGARNIISGVQFAGSNAKVSLGGTNNKLLGNRFTGWSGNAVQPSAGSEGEVAYNEFSEPAAWGPVTSSTQFRMGIRGVEDGESTVHRDAWIHDNWFHDFPEKPDPTVFSSGQSDAIEVCEWNAAWLPTLLVGWYIERNLIERHRQTGEAAIDLKCGGIVLRHNTVLDSARVRLDLRYGQSSVMESNWIETGGSVVQSGNHKVIGNYVRGGNGIHLISGDMDWNSGGRNGHPRSFKALVAGNDSNSLLVGKAYNASMNEFPALDNVIEQHTGPISRDVEENTTIRSTTNVPFDPPFRLTASDVGPAAMGQASNSYLACRAP